MALVEVDGIPVEVDARVFTDMRFVRYYGKLTDENLDGVERFKYMAKIIDMVFGDDADAILDALADKNGGYVGTEQFGDFIAAMTEALPDLKG